MRSKRFPDLPPLGSLVEFEAAGYYQSFSKAAEELCISASAVAHQVKKLEADIGIKLFIRHPRGVNLSPQGRDYFVQVHAQFEELQRHSERLRDYSRRPLRIVTQHAIAQLWLQPRLNEYQNEYDHELEITAVSLIDTPPVDADIVIGFFSVPPASRSWQPLWDENLLPVCSPQYAETDAVLYEDFHWQSDWRFWQTNAGAGGVIEFKRIRRASLYVLVLQSVLDGHGVMVARESLLRPYLHRGELIPWGKVATVTVGYGGYYLYRSPGGLQNARVNRFCAWLATQSEGFR